MQFKFLAAASAVLLLCACHPAPPAQVTTQTMSLQANKTPLQRDSLWFDGTLREAAPLPFSVIRSDSDRVTLTWDGDAVELLRDLARARGQVFSYAGVRLPLPVNIDVQGVTYANLLRIVEMQTAWRATMVTYPGQMVLQFMPTVPAEPGRYKGGRR